MSTRSYVVQDQDGARTEPITFAEAKAHVLRYGGDIRLTEAALARVRAHHTATNLAAAVEYGLD